MDYADSQRQSSISLEVKHPQQTLKITIIFFLLLWTILWTWILIMYFSLNFWQYLCRTFPIVDEHVKEAMGDSLYDLFMVRRKHRYNIDEWFYMWTVNRKQREILIYDLKVIHKGGNNIYYINIDCTRGLLGKLSPQEKQCRPRRSRGWHWFSRGDNFHVTLSCSQ